jgi:hypothetical protein
MRKMLVIGAMLMLTKNAFAMPAWDGIYNCKTKEQTGGVLIVKTVNGKLVLQGFDTGSPAMNNGLECANKSSGPMVSGSISMSIDSACDDKSLKQTISMTAGNTTTAIKISLVQTSPNNLNISVAIGNPNDPSEMVSADLSCTK